MESLMGTKNVKRQIKRTQKRTTLLQKLAYIVKPFVVYMLVKTAAMLFLAIAIPVLPIAGIAVWVEHNSRPLSAVVNGVASLVGVRFLLNDFLIEASTTGEVDIDSSVFVQFLSFLKTDLFEKMIARKASRLIVCIFLGITASLAFNIGIELAAEFSTSGKNLFGSQRYETVETIQYSVPIGLGIVLYGIISPFVEEIVFRGVLYNRIRKFYSMKMAVVFSALLFGFFHANLPQFLYGTAMGILMAVCYAFTDCFAAPVLLHMSANLFIFLASGFTEWTALLVKPIWCVIFTITSIGFLFYVHGRGKYS